MKDTIKLVFVLTIICTICSALLAAVFQVTEKPIAQSLEKRTASAAALVLPPECGVPEKLVYTCPKKDAAQPEKKITYFEAKKDGKPIAWAYEGEANGYGGPVKLMVGIGKDGKMISFEVIQSTETPGLGSKMGQDAFKKPLCGKSLRSDWKVKKDGGDVDAITAATISSRAALECIRNAKSKHELIHKITL